MMARTVVCLVVGALAFGCSNAPTAGVKGGTARAEPSLLARAATRLSGYQWQRVKTVVRSKFRLERLGKVKPPTRMKPRTSSPTPP